MKHTIEFDDGSTKTFEDGPIRSHDVQLTPLGIRIISLHKLSADETASMLFPWSGIRMYTMLGNPATMVKTSQENGS